MSLEAILAVIHESAQIQVAEIEAQAAADAARITGEAESALPALREAAQQDALAAAAVERSRLLHRARLQAMQAAGEARYALVERALRLTGDQLQAYRASSAYPALFQRLLAEALDVLQGSLEAGEIPVVQVDTRDRSLVEDWLDEHSVQATIAEMALDWGGVTVTSADGRVVVDNTLHSRLARATPYLHRYLPHLLEDELAG